VTRSRIPDALQRGLTLPVIAAPMFLTSGPDLVIACCKAGIIGTFPALNQRSTEGLDEWLTQIKQALQTHEQETGTPAAPFGVNLIVHKSNPRLQADLEVCIRHKVPLVITSLGAVADVVDAVHAYGGAVFHDVINARHARKAASVGVDGLIGVAAGAGGHAGTWSPFALVNEIRAFFDGTIVLAGSLSTGQDIAAAEMMGADLAYMGTRFISTQESMVQNAYKEQIIAASASDIVYTPAISGVNANFLKPSILAAGLNLETLEKPEHVDFGAELDDAQSESTGEAKPWKDIWSAGQGVGSIQDTPSAGTLVAQLHDDYRAAWTRRNDFD